jgi:hypothetical protein
MAEQNTSREQHCNRKHVSFWGVLISGQQFRRAILHNRTKLSNIHHIKSALQQQLKTRKKKKNKTQTFNNCSPTIQYNLLKSSLTNSVSGRNCKCLKFFLFSSQTRPFTNLKNIFLILNKIQQSKGTAFLFFLSFPTLQHWNSNVRLTVHLPM